MSDQRKTTPGDHNKVLRVASRPRAMEAVMLRLDGFNDREIGRWLGCTSAHISSIRRHTDAPLRVGAILVALRDHARNRS